MGALGSGGAILAGTGAFTSVEADRDISVQVADDTNAFLRIAAAGEGNDEYVTTEGGELGIDLTSDNRTDAGGQGVNADATTVIADLFEVQNQGTQEVEVEATPLSFVDNGNGNTLVVLVVPQTAFPGVPLGVGDSETYSLVVDSFPGGGNVQIDDTISVTAEAI
jgi:hypothetical protein